MLLLVAIAAAPVSHAQTEVSALTLLSGEARLASAIIDTSSGFAYFGTDTSPGVVVKVRLSDFSRVGALTLNPGQDHLVSAVIDTLNGFAYFGTGTVPGIVVKIRLSDFTVVGTLVLNTGEDDLASAVIDHVAGFAYFGTNTSPGVVVKIRLSDFSRVGALSLGPNESNLASAAIDFTNGFAYFGTNTQPGIIVKVRLSNLTRVDALTLNDPEGAVHLILYKSYIGGGEGGPGLFVGTGSSPAVFVVIRLLDFTRITSIALNAGEDNIVSGGIITGPAGLNSYAYLGTNTGGAQDMIVKVDVSDPIHHLNPVNSLILNSGEVDPRAAVMDASNNFAYFGTYTDLGVVVKVNGAGQPAATTTTAVTLSTATHSGESGPSLMTSLGSPWLLSGMIAIVAVVSFVFVMKRRTPGVALTPVEMAASKVELLEKTVASQPMISTGYAELDRVLGGGLPVGYRVLLISPSLDERDLLLRRLIRSAMSSSIATFFLSADLDRSSNLVREYERGLRFMRH